MVQTVTRAAVEWATARMCARGQADSGDECVVRALEGRTLIAVIDALGHGKAASHVAKECTRLLEEAETADLIDLVHFCHERLRGSRGLVMSLALIDASQHSLTWIGIGNVSGTLWCPRASQRRTLLLRGGLVGSALPRLQVSVVPVTEGDTLVFATDGVARTIDTGLLRGSSVHDIAERILNTCSSGRDDALALVARYRG